MATSSCDSKPIPFAGERHEYDGPPPGFGPPQPANGFTSGYGPSSSAAGGREQPDGSAFERPLPPSANPYAIPVAAAAGGARGSKQAAAAAAANGGYSGGAGVPASQAGFASQVGFATQLPSQQAFAFTQAFTGLTQDSFAAPSELQLELEKSQRQGQSQAAEGLSQYDSYFAQQ